MSGEYGRPVLFGAVLAVLVVAGIAAWVVLGGDLGTPQDVDAILVTLVTPDEEGVQLPQAMAYFELGTAGVGATAVDPDLEVTLAGSSYTRLRDSYPFGGGDLLAQTWADSAGVESPEWIVVTQDVWLTLARDSDVTLDMPVDAEVFDGVTLYSFESGVGTYTGPEVVALMKGVDYLETDERADVRSQLMLELARLLSTAGDDVSVRTSLPDDLLATWMVRLGS